jgi:hypothetical protein
MATLTKQTISLTGTQPTYAAAAGGGDKVAPGPSVFLHVKNTGGSACTVTIDDPTSLSPSGATTFNPDLAVTVPATTGDRFIGPITERFLNPADGLAAITYNQVAGVTVAALQL